MDIQIQELQRLVKVFLYSSREEIYKKWGTPQKKSDQEIWFYSRYRWLVFKDEMAFIFKEDKVIDICLTEYFLRKEIRGIFYYEGESPEYRIMTPMKYKSKEAVKNKITEILTRSGVLRKIEGKRNRIMSR